MTKNVNIITLPHDRCNSAITTIARVDCMRFVWETSDIAPTGDGNGAPSMWNAHYTTH